MQEILQKGGVYMPESIQRFIVMNRVDLIIVGAIFFNLVSFIIGWVFRHVYDKLPE